MPGTPPPPSPCPPGIPSGLSDFRDLRRPGIHYVDKTDFVAGVVASVDAVLLFPRPRRFGKTVNLSTLRCFVEKSGEDMRPLFAGLAIEQRPEAWEHFQRYPVIYMTFKDVKAKSFALAFSAIRQEIAAAYRQHRYLLEGDTLDEQQKRHFVQILDEEGDETLYWGSLLDLSGYLHRYHGERVAILIDAHDTHAAGSTRATSRRCSAARASPSGSTRTSPSATCRRTPTWSGASCSSRGTSPRRASGSATRWSRPG